MLSLIRRSYPEWITKVFHCLSISSNMISSLALTIAPVIILPVTLPIILYLEYIFTPECQAVNFIFMTTRISHILHSFNLHAPSLVSHGLYAQTSNSLLIKSTCVSFLGNRLTYDPNTRYIYHNNIYHYN